MRLDRLVVRGELAEAFPQPVGDVEPDRCALTDSSSGKNDPEPVHAARRAQHGLHCAQGRRLHRRQDRIRVETTGVGVLARMQVFASGRLSRPPQGSVQQQPSW